MAPNSPTTTPLLNTPHKPPSPSHTSPAIVLLAGLKAVFGLSCLLAPRLTHALLLLDAPTAQQAAVVTRLYGGAVVALGYLLWAAGRARARGEVSAQLLRHVVVVNIVADAVDVVSCAAGFATGAVRPLVLGVVGGACAALAALGAVAYRSVRG